MTEAERRIALEQIAAEVRACTRCRLHEQRTRAVPGEGNPDTEVVFVGEGPGFNEDQEGRPFVGRAGGLLVRLLASIGWRREDVFITNVVKCRPPDNRDPQPDEIAACAPFLRRQLEALDPALVVTLGRYSMGTFMPGARISQAHGTMKPAAPEAGARDALAFAMYHPAAALRATELERTSFADMATIPATLLKARELRERHRADEATPTDPNGIDVATISGQLLHESTFAASRIEGPVAAEAVEAVAVLEAEEPRDDMDSVPDVEIAAVLAPAAATSFAAHQPRDADPSTDQLTLF